MGYNQALEAAGAEVLAFRMFGSYQGDWYALVNYNGTRQWVHGSFGSCSYCDAFESEFDYCDSGNCSEHRYDDEDAIAACADCKNAGAAYAQKLAAFGLSYLTSSTMTQEEAEKLASENLEWDSDAPEMLQYLQDNSTKGKANAN